MIQNDLFPPRAVGGVLPVRDLQTLSRWCAARRMEWLPGNSSDAGEVILIEPASGNGLWPRLALFRQARLYGLVDEWGEILAEASELSALLDALDGGIAGGAEPGGSAVAPGAGPSRCGLFV